MYESSRALHHGGSVLRSAVARMHREGMVGCKTIFDVPMAYFSPKSDEELRKALL